MLKTVIFDLNDVLQICEGGKKQTNYHRQLIKDLAKGMIPKTWRRYTIPKNLIIEPWIVDFALRIKQMSEISKQFAEQGKLLADKREFYWVKKNSRMVLKNCVIKKKFGNNSFNLRSHLILVDYIFNPIFQKFYHIKFVEILSFKIMKQN